MYGVETELHQRLGLIRVSVIPVIPVRLRLNIKLGIKIKPTGQYFSADRKCVKTQPALRPTSSSSLRGRGNLYNNLLTEI